MTAEAIDLIGRNAIDAADADAEPRAIDPARPLYLRALDDTRHMEVRHLEQFMPAPQRARGGAVLHDLPSFLTYVNRLGAPETTIWAHERVGTVSAVFNDHGGSTPGWRDHTARLALQPDPDWQLWTNSDGSLGDQEWFAEHIEDTAHTIRNPDAATMHMIAMTFKAHSKAEFNRSTRLESGDVALTYSEETTAKAGGKGNIEVPERFAIELRPFVGAEPQQLIARLRYRIRDGGLRIGYKLLRPDEARRQAFETIVDGVRDALRIEAPVMYGTTPEAEDAHR
ncbi:DUF2303 family protein [Sciscionella sediminilitoris]|uniref:DUF2303 family protein n=1 Tax=Sciscionella sediminilitoris TaxID=1445613 RepID=UPI0004DF5D32|nr:DUF2303 family protein [Sciscionella sp. SE31]